MGSFNIEKLEINNEENFDTILEDTKKYPFPEALQKKTFLKIPQYLQENILCGISLLKRDSNTGVFQLILQKMLRTVFYKIPLVAGSERINEKKSVIVFDHINEFMFFWVSHNNKYYKKGFSSLRLFR